MIKWLKALFGYKKVEQKKVLEKIKIDTNFKKKHLPANKKNGKKQYKRK